MVLVEVKEEPLDEEEEQLQAVLQWGAAARCDPRRLQPLPLWS